MKGRILLAREGINGSLSASSEGILNQYINEMEQFNLLEALSGHTTSVNTDLEKESGFLFRSIDWKKSQGHELLSTSVKSPFPDLKISIQKEIVSTGGAITVSDLEEYGGSHLTPTEFHEVLLSNQKNASKTFAGNDDNNSIVLIDVRNTFEYAIGRFSDGNDNDAMNPVMTNFSSFDTSFCAKKAQELKDKKVLMYCTGGIRCEKASAMLRRRGVKDVSQLSGGIHRYLEKYGSSGFFKGKNFVFDQRVAMPASPSDNTVVGTCTDCCNPFDEISGSRLCSVCRDLVLVCPKCQNSLLEYHCEKHADWKHCYFTFLDVFEIDQLLQQHEDLKRLHLNQTSKNVRKTLLKQMRKVHEKIDNIKTGNAVPNPNAPKRCRTCFLSIDDGECDGLCWGFWKKSAVIDSTERNSPAILPPHIGDEVEPGPDWNESRLGSRNSMKEITGIVTDIKSWGSEGTNNDCVVVKWDTDMNSFQNHRTQIYRWGAPSKAGKRMYDVQTKVK